MSELAQPAAQPPVELLAPCKAPADLRGFQALAAGPVERLWFADRVELADCRARRDALQAFYAARDAGLAGLR